MAKKQTKTCTLCKKELSLDKFSDGQARCKKCRSKAELARLSKKKEAVSLKADELVDTITQDELKDLRELLQVKQQLLDLLSHKADHNNTITTSKADRVKKTYNIDLNIINTMNEYSKDSGINQSDIVNAALMQYLLDHNAFLF